MIHKAISTSVADKYLFIIHKARDSRDPSTKGWATKPAYIKAPVTTSGRIILEKFIILKGE